MNKIFGWNLKDFILFIERFINMYCNSLYLSGYKDVDCNVGVKWYFLH